MKVTDRLQYPTILSSVLLLIGLSWVQPSMIAATFYYVETSGGGNQAEEYSSLANLQSGTTASSTAFNWPSGNQDGFAGIGTDGSNFYGLWSGFAVTYNSFANLTTNTQSPAGVAWGGGSTTFVFGVAADTTGKFWILFDSGSGANQIIREYADVAGFRANTGFTDTQVTWDIAAPAANTTVRDFAFEGGQYHVAFTDSTANDFLVTYSSLAELAADTDITDAGTGGGTISTMGGGGPDFSNGRALAAFTPVPEPATYGLISGLILLGTAHFRRRKRK